MNELFEQLRIAFLGPKDRPMNKFLKRAGISILIMIFALLAKEALETPFRVWVDRIYGAMLVVAVVSFGIAVFIEPNLPKRDRRFKNGFKNNAVPRKKNSHRNPGSENCDKSWPHFSGSAHT